MYDKYRPTCQQKSEQLRRAVYDVRQQTKDTSGKNALQTLNKKYRSRLVVLYVLF